MRNRFRFLFVAVLALVGAAHIAEAQSSADQNRSRNRLIVDGVVESVGGRLQISLINTDNVQSVSGSARVSLGASDQQSERIEFTLAPQESRLIPLRSRGEPGDNYTLSIYEKAGALISLKNAPVKRGSVAAPIATDPAPAIPDPVPTATTTAEVKELTIKARLAAANPSPSRGADIKSRAAQQSGQPQSHQAVTPTLEQSGEPQDAKIKKPSAKLARREQSAELKTPAAEILRVPQNVEHLTRLQAVKGPVPIEAPISDDPGPMSLIFEIAAPEPIINASLSINANEFKQRQAVTVQNRANVEFTLPEDFEEPKVNYTLADASGRTLAQGELMLESLRQEDSVTLSDVKTDKETYDPGESVHFVVTLEGLSQNGYLLEVSAKDANTETLLRDSRKGVYSKGKSMQEFRIEIPAEAKGLITVEFKAFGGLTRRLFGYVVREIIINDTETEKKEDRVSKIEN